MLVHDFTLCYMDVMLRNVQVRGYVDDCKQPKKANRLVECSPERELARQDSGDRKRVNVAASLGALLDPALFMEAAHHSLKDVLKLLASSFWHGRLS